MPKPINVGIFIATNLDTLWRPGQCARSGGSE